MNKQSGSAHVIIVAILAIGLIGALGFIFWQNFIQDNKQVSAKDSTSVASDDLAGKETAGDTNESSLQIEEWGIKIPEAAEFTVVKSSRSDELDGSNAYTVYEVSTVEIRGEAEALECSDDKLGGVVKVRASDVQEGNPYTLVTQKIGDFLYLYSPRSQAACVGDDGVGPEKINGLMDEANKKFAALFVKTTSID